MQNRNFKTFFRLVHWVIYCIAISAFFGSFWLYRTFGKINFDQFKTTILLGFDGVMPEVYWAALKWLVLLPAVILILIYISEYFRKKSKNCAAVFVSSGLLFIALFIIIRVNFSPITFTSWNDIFDKYTYPNLNEIKPNKQNLNNVIWIYVESLEKDYADPEVMRELNAVTDFMQPLDVEPLVNKYTIGAIMSSRCAAPLFLGSILSPNHYSKSPFKKATCIDDFFHSSGYESEFLTGQDANFSGLADYFESHAKANIYDKKYFQKFGYAKHSSFDSYPDEDIFNFAANQLIGNRKLPFAMTILTLDNHAPTGFPSYSCQKSYGLLMPDIIRCNNSSLSKFIKTLKENGTLRNTVLIVMGDHPFMGNFSGLGSRGIFAKIYNPSGSESKLKSVTPFDFYPSVLAAAGFNIDNRRIGFGYSFYDVQDYPNKNWQLKLEDSFRGSPPARYMELHR